MTADAIKLELERIRGDIKNLDAVRQNAKIMTTEVGEGRINA